MGCLVCSGTGTYAIYNQRGLHVYDIRCPDCLGTGESEEELEQRQRESYDRGRYESAIAQMRTSTPKEAD